MVRYTIEDRDPIPRISVNKICKNPLSYKSREQEEMVVAITVTLVSFRNVLDKNIFISNHEQAGMAFKET